ncbi:hypothetical protein JFL43_00935 [Viridibacillus sp. YIM B01967]|uniref:Uncharacterized protein n=1 Tax=Viridibacillus soli TaxID=2798301 RepID=A0ABS1H229_9BACL|nr:hypothetical protein [Viridibacillus soli]MBK3493455.1 hypothetical protein [Viridibacillus soli]
MQHISWEIAEGFNFPESFGKPQEASNVKITPRWTQEESGESVFLTGIYHISANVAFAKGEEPHHGTSTWTTIEDLDMQGESGYFEYAVPLHVNLPKERVNSDVPVQLKVDKIATTFQGDGSCHFNWQATCHYDEPQVAVAEVIIENSPSPVVQEVIEEPQSDVFLWDLEDTYTIKSYALKEIRK